MKNSAAKSCRLRVEERHAEGQQRSARARCGPFKEVDEKQKCRQEKILAAFVTNLAALACGEQRAQVAGAFGGTELAQGFGFDLADAFAGYVEFLADFF